jgi:hypothetical protein
MQASLALRPPSDRAAWYRASPLIIGQVGLAARPPSPQFRRETVVPMVVTQVWLAATPGQPSGVADVTVAEPRSSNAYR